MRKAIVILSILLVVAFTVDTNNDEDYKASWEQWKATYNKVYSTAKEEAERFQVYVENFKDSIKYNSGPNKISITFASDRFPDELNELERIYTGPWRQWKDTYNKEYSSQEEEFEAFKNYLDADERINKFNEEHKTSKIGHNQFSDLTKEEFAATHLGFKKGNAADEELVACPAEHDKYVFLWNQWRHSNKKVYDSLEEEAKRLEIFIENVKFIHEFNRANPDVRLTINEFADQTSEEFAATHKGLKRPDATEAKFEFLWNQWKHSHKKVYDSVAEEAERFKIFVENAKFIAKFNKGNPDVKLTLNEFADQTSEEFVATHTGFKTTQ